MPDVVQSRKEMGSGGAKPVKTEEGDGGQTEAAPAEAMEIVEHGVEIPVEKARVLKGN